MSPPNQNSEIYDTFTKPDDHLPLLWGGENQKTVAILYVKCHFFGRHFMILGTQNSFKPKQHPKHPLPPVFRKYDCTPKICQKHRSPQEVFSSEVRSLISLAKMIVHPNHSLGMSRATSKKRRHLLAGAIAVIHLHEILLKVLPTGGLDEDVRSKTTTVGGLSGRFWPQNPWIFRGFSGK